MKKPSPKHVTISSTESVTPNMQRITFQSDALKEFPNNCEGGYIKLLFTPTGDTDPQQLSGDERPVMRTYTIRKFDEQAGTIEVDFVKHITHDLKCGFAAHWAMKAQVGDSIHIAGPGTIQDMSTDADWFFMTADMTALPALSAKIRRLPADVKGYAVIKVISEQDIQPIESPEHFEVKWIFENDDLAQAVRDLPWLAGKASVWCACEFDSMRALRQYFRNEKEVERENIYISSYWKQGVSEDGHKVIKRQDAEEQEA
ncbi:siderophore-interacting protein [Vibrio tubiashii]|uniref:siderophore-interacting protein n=1 Tax=Vibrio tubiashii TaxID=29498 RepID=UPI001EFCEA1C|nr:siderophore-interacting protein [Vibrio tubiashii]MCG9577476.1 siderophore-interacting protein [Vibrio tubiashii]